MMMGFLVKKMLFWGVACALSCSIEGMELPAQQRFLTKRRPGSPVRTRDNERGGRANHRCINHANASHGNNAVHVQGASENNGIHPAEVNLADVHPMGVHPLHAAVVIVHQAPVVVPDTVFARLTGSVPERKDRIN